jgi:hypothetical protein
LLEIPEEINYEDSNKQKNDDASWDRNFCFWYFCHGHAFHEGF